MARDSSTSPRRKRKEKDPEGRMSLGEHLSELRNRLLWCAAAVFVGSVIGWFLYDWVFELLNQPFAEARGKGIDAYTNLSTVGQALDVKLRVSAYVGLILSAPMFMYQTWMYVVPGLHMNERKYALGFFGTAIPLFAIGCVMGYFGMTRLVPVLLGFAPGEGAFVQNIAFDTYLAMFVKTMLAFGIAFTMPVVLVLINFMGIVSGKAMLAAWRWVIFLCFAFIAIMVPTPDPLTLIGMTLPVVGLYFTAIGIAIINDKRREKKLLEQGNNIGAPSAIDGPASLEELKQRTQPTDPA